MSGKGTDEFELWPVKHHGNYRYTGRRYYDYTNSYGYYYSVKQYTYWDGILHSRTNYYASDREVEYIEKVMKAVAEAHHNPMQIRIIRLHSMWLTITDSSRLVIVPLLSNLY